MGMAEEDQIVEVREPAVGPFDDVMGLCPPGWSVTAREPTPSVADNQRLVLDGARQASAAPEIQDLARTLEQHGGDVGVARKSAGGVDGDRFAGGEQSPTSG